MCGVLIGCGEYIRLLSKRQGPYALQSYDSGAVDQSRTVSSLHCDIVSCHAAR
jgi:hypothetical protein